MERTSCVIWFLYLSASDGWPLPNSQQSREIQSPLYPQPYLPNLLKQLDLWVPDGYQMELTLTHLDIKSSAGCSQDSLTVFYGQKILGKFCGQEDSTDQSANETIVSEGNRLTLIFQTSDFTPDLQLHTGFSGTYKAIDIDECSKPDPGSGSVPLCSQICVNTPGSYHCSCFSGYKLQSDKHTCSLSCGGCIFDQHQGHLSSPGYPRPSLPLLTCKYIISVEPGRTVTLNFTDNFHIESVDTQQGPRCSRHWLQVTIPDREPIKLCGTKSPGLLATNSSTVRLDYHTDNEGLSRGWSLHYSTEEIDCGEPEPLLNGSVTFLSGFQNQYHSVVQYHCNEPFYSLPGGINVTFTCEADRKWRSNHKDVNLTCIPVCGRPTKLISAYQRIIGGSRAPESAIPWHVLMSVDGQRAGGMVIADRWIMSAAGILTYNGNNGNPVSNTSVRIYMGHTDVQTLVSPMYAAAIHIHPEYNNPNLVDFNNDIALIKLEDPITFSSSIMPICLPAEGATYVTGMMGLVSGFGLTETDHKWILTNKLKYVQLPVVAQEMCDASITVSRRTKPNVPGLTDNMFCAGFPEGGKDACQGDSGGPFSLTEDDGRFWAAGIVSWGVDCGQQGTYGVYTRVANYLDWIKQTMQEN